MATKPPNAHRSWFRVALHDPKRGTTELVAAAGEHLGAAIAAAEAHAPGAHAVAALDATDTEIPLGEAVGKQPVVALPEDTDKFPTFAWPVGIVPALGPGLAKLEKAARGFAIVREADPFAIEAQVARDELGEVMMSLIERLPAADNLEITLMAHYDDAQTSDVWNTSRVNAKKIIAFLDERDVELFGNGHLEIAVYLRAQKATLRLTEHKTIVWTSENRAMEGDVVRWLGELGIPPAEGPLVRAASVPHFPYRPGRSRDREKLGEELYRQRLRRVARLDAQGKPIVPLKLPRERN